MPHREIVFKKCELSNCKTVQNAIPPRENYIAEMYTIDISYFYLRITESTIETHQGVTGTN